MLTDTDFYKITMSYAINKLYPDVRARYRLQIRNNNLPDNFAATAKKKLDDVFFLKSSGFGCDVLHQCLDHLKIRSPYINHKELVNYILSIDINPDKNLDYKIDENGDLHLEISGLWRDVIHYEIPILTILGETYHDLNIKNAPEMSSYAILDDIKHKISEINEIGRKYCEPIYISEFGTRRRISFDYQHEVISAMRHKQFDFIRYMGTSNVLLSMMYGSTPVGTMAHEWIQAHSVFFGAYHANHAALVSWNHVYRGNLGIALTDTYGTDLFVDNFKLDVAKLYDGLRHDSGDPCEFLFNMNKVYKQYGIDRSTKQIIFSDSVTAEMIEKVIRYEKTKLFSGFKISFGIGSYLAGRISGLSDTPANMVIKLTHMDGVPVCKLSDINGKEFGDPLVIDYTKKVRDEYLADKKEV